VLLNLYAFFDSQESFKAVEQERKLRVTTSRNASLFRHRTFNDFEVQHVSYQSECCLVVLYLKHIIVLSYVYISVFFLSFCSCA